MNRKVGVLGLGAMGSALARAQLKAGHQTKVWNRTPRKMDILVSEGAQAEDTGAQVALTSDVILVCVDTCASAEASLGPALVPGALDGRVIVQLGTSSPVEARRFAKLVKNAGAAALDGAIMCYPDSVGPKNQAPVMIGGDREGMELAKLTLKQISANLIDLGDNIAAAAALDLGYLTMSIALYAGAAHAARLCEVEGASVELLAQLSANGPRATDRLNIIEKDAFELGSLHDGGSLAVWAEVAKRVQQHAVDSKIEPPLVCRRPRSKDTGLWKRTNVETDIHLKCASGLYGWCSNIRANLTANLLRSSRSCLRLVAGRIRFVRGFGALRRTAVNVMVWQAPNVTGSKPWNARTASFGKPMRY